MIQKRNYFAIHFESEHDKTLLHTNEFLKTDPYNINEVLDLAEYFCGGGTLFHPALELAQDKINMEKEFSKADIIFITDGESTVSDEFAEQFRAWKKQKNVKKQLIDEMKNSEIFKTVMDRFPDAELIDVNSNKDGVDND